jgi:hypothetical protein
MRAGHVDIRTRSQPTELAARIALRESVPAATDLDFGDEQRYGGHPCGGRADALGDDRLGAREVVGDAGLVA